MLEAVAGARADQHDMPRVGMAIDQEIAVAAVLILADAGFDELRARQRWKAPRQIAPRLGDAGGGCDPVADIGIDRRAVPVEGELEAAVLDIGKAVGDVATVEIGPARQCGGHETRIAGRRREEEHLLPGREDSASEQRREQLGQPWPAGEDIVRCGQARAAARDDAVRHRTGRR